MVLELRLGEAHTWSIHGTYMVHLHGVPALVLCLVEGRQLDSRLKARLASDSHLKTYPHPINSESDLVLRRDGPQAVDKDER